MESLKTNNKIDMFNIHMLTIPGFNVTNYESQSKFVVWNIEFVFSIFDPFYRSTLFTDKPSDSTLLTNFDISFTPPFLKGGLHTMINAKILFWCQIKEEDQGIKMRPLQRICLYLNFKNAIQSLFFKKNVTPPPYCGTTIKRMAFYDTAL